MHICFINTTKAWGGGEKWHYDMAKAMLKKGLKISLITNKKGDLNKKLQGSACQNIAINISSKSYLNPFAYRKVRKLLEELAPDSVILNLSLDLKVAGIAAKKAGVRNIIYRRGSAIPISNSFSNRYLFKNVVTGIIANSEATKATINKYNPHLFPKEKIQVIYNGIDSKYYQEASAPDQDRQKPWTIGNLGRLVEQKGQSDLIKLAQLLKKEDIPFKVLIGGDGKLKSQLELQIHEAGVESEVQLLGHIENVKEFMNQLDVFVLSSRWEGFGYVVVEAAACGKPTIAYNLSSNPEVVEHERTGYLVEPKNLSELVQKIKQLHSDRKLYKYLAHNAVQMVENKFDINICEARVFDYLNSLP